MRKGYFAIDGNTDPEEVFEGYTDDTTWNGWACVTFTKEQMEIWLKSSPYDYRFMEVGHQFNKFNVPAVLIYFEEETTIESTPFVIENGDLVEGYYMDGYCFVEMNKTGENDFEPLW